MDDLSHLPPQLMELYADTKRSCDAVDDPRKVENVPELTSLHHKFHIENKRLKEWAVEWSEQSARAQLGYADESLARAGFPDKIRNILNQIKDIFDEAEKIRCSDGRGLDTKGGKDMAPIVMSADRKWELADKSRYEDLVRELSAAIDRLYVMSRARDDLPLGRPRKKIDRPKKFLPMNESLLSVQKSSIDSPPASPFLTPSQTMSSVTPTVFSRASVSASSMRSSMTSISPEALPKLDSSFLTLSGEEPPPYQGLGYTFPPRLMGHHRQTVANKVSGSTGGSYLMVPVLVEYAQYDPSTLSNLKYPSLQRLEKLLEHLRWSPDTIDLSPVGSLACRGYYEDARNSRFGFVYDLPRFVYSGPSDSSRSLEDFKPVSLLNLLCLTSKSSQAVAQLQSPALEERFRLAASIVRIYSRLLDTDFLHKDLNCGNILLFKRLELPVQAQLSYISDYNLASPFLGGFDLFSDVQVTSAPNVSQTISRHPADSRNGSSKATDYTVGFDLYSLGLILLEIGLWVPLFDLYKAKYSLKDFKERVENIWLEKLIPKCGSVYARAVQACLNYEDVFPNETSGSMHARPALDDVLSQLRRCCMIDEEESTNPVNPSQSTVASAAARPDVPISPEPEADKYPAMDEDTASLTKSISASFSTKSKIPNFLRKLKSDGRYSSQGSEYKYRSFQARFQKFSASTASLSEENDSRVNKRTTPTQSSSDLANLYKDAVTVIQRAWRTHREHRSYKDYRRKVVIIQLQWRKRKVKTSQRSESDDGDVGGLDANADIRNVEVVDEENVPSPRSKSKHRVYPVQLDQVKLEQWHNDMLPKLEKLLAKVLCKSKESVSIDLVAIGKSKRRAQPTILITCSSTSEVKAAMKKFKYDRNEFKLKVRSGAIRRSAVSKSKRRQRPPHRSMATIQCAGSTLHPQNPYHQHKPLCGASIGAYRNEHLPPVSYGGIVLVDGRPFGMSVHHLLDPPSDDECSDFERDSIHSPTRSSYVGERQSRTTSNYGSDDSDGQTISDYASDSSNYGSEDENDNNSINGSDSDDACSRPYIEWNVGDIDGVKATSNEEIRITQPAIDDVEENFFVNPHFPDEEHLSSHKLGHVYASSGIRRWNVDGTLHEIDWSLFQVSEDRIQRCNLVQGGKRYFRAARRPPNVHLDLPVCRVNYPPEDDEYPHRVARATDLGGLRVHSIGRTSGLKGGVVGPAMSSVKVYKRENFSRSWHVVGGFGGKNISGSNILAL